MRRSLGESELGDILERLRAANLDFAARFPGDPAGRQPVHTVYGGAHLFRANTAAKLGAAALEALARHAPNPGDLARILELPGDAEDLHHRVVAKLEREPVEDFRIDFEDGYGHRPDDEEDAHAVACAREVRRGREEGALPPFLGIRIKPLTEELRARAIRTLDIFLTEVGEPPPGFVVTLPKPTHPTQVGALAAILERLEAHLGLPPRTLKIDLMVETPQALVCLRPMVDAAEGRCVAAAFGTYDLTALLGITPEHQDMNHPACNFARLAMRVALAQSGVALSDGATNILPVGETPTVHRAWRLHARHIRRSLELGFTQGWDLHPAQLPSRYATVFWFFRQSLPQATARLRSFVEKAARATLQADVFDDAATGQAMLNFFLRGIACGALQESEALATGLTLEELRGRSFARILERRRT